MTDAEYEAVQAAYQALKLEANQAWQAKENAAEAWYVVARKRDEVLAAVEKETQRRVWRAEFAATTQETAA